MYFFKYTVDYYKIIFIIRNDYHYSDNFNTTHISWTREFYNTRLWRVVEVDLRELVDKICARLWIIRRIILLAPSFMKNFRNVLTPVSLYVSVSESTSYQCSQFHRRN